MAEAAGGNSALEPWQSNAATLSLTWHRFGQIGFVLREGDHRYAVLKRPPREGWLWSWE